MISHGKYDVLVTDVRERTLARGVLLIILDGVHGNGFSAQIEGSLVVDVPGILRKLADEIEASFQTTSFTTAE